MICKYIYALFVEPEELIEHSHGPAQSLDLVASCSLLVLSNCFVESQSYCTEMSLRSTFSSEGKPALEGRPISSFPCTLIPSLLQEMYVRMFHGHMDLAQTMNCWHCHFPKDHGNTASEISSHCMKHRV